MTEKRFILTEQFNGLQGVTFVNDNFTDVDTYYTVDGAVDLLNDLSDENEQLSEQLVDWETSFDICKAEKNELLEENRRLRLELDTHKHPLWSTREAERIINELKDENEQLKKELKRCKDWVNSDKNDYELTLAFIKNKGYSLKDVLEYEKELKE